MSESDTKFRFDGKSAEVKVRGSGADVGVSTKQIRMGLAAMAFLLSAASLAIYCQRPPAAKSDSAPPEEFSARRAMKYLRMIGQKPHPVGSPEHAQVHTAILSALTALGLDPQVDQSMATISHSSTGFEGATVRNIVTLVKGFDTTGSILLVAHYDSVPGAPGAGDDGAGVAVLLETLRALKASPQLRNNLIVLLTDGEELGLLGAKAFVDKSPLVKEVKLAINFEGRGNYGPALMFETSKDNGWLIEQFAAASPYPFANSLSYEIYKRLPNDTDLTVFKQAGFEGLNFAFINGVTHYHTRLDSIENIDERSIEHQGAYALSLARRLGNVNLDHPRQKDSVYFDILGLYLIHYSTRLTAPFTIAAATLYIGVLVLGFKRRILSVLRIILGFSAQLLCVVLSAAAGWAAWQAALLINPAYKLMPEGQTYNSAFYQICFVAIAVSVSSAVYGWASKIGIENLTIGSLLLWLALLALITLFLPGGTYLFLWPLVFSLSGLALRITKKGWVSSWKLLVSSCLFAVPAMILLVPMVYWVFVGLPLQTGGAVSAFVVLLLGSLLPLLQFIIERSVKPLALSSLAVAVSLFLYASLTAKFDQNHPRPSTLFYTLNSDTGAAAWATTDNPPDEWTSKFFSQRGTNAVPLKEFFPFSRGSFLTSPATAITMPHSNVELVDSAPSNGGRSLSFHVSPARPVALASIYISSKAGIAAAYINGSRISLAGSSIGDGQEQKWKLRFYAIPTAGLDLKLEMKGSDALLMTVVDQSYGLEEVLGSSAVERAASVMASRSWVSDSILVSKSFAFY